MENNFRRFAEFLGVEFNKPFMCKGSNETFIIKEKGVAYINRECSCDYDSVLIIRLVEGKLVPIVEPKEGDIVYYLEKYIDKGYSDLTFNPCAHKKTWEQGRLYKTLEEAEEAIKKLGWSVE